MVNNIKRNTMGKENKEYCKCFKWESCKCCETAETAETAEHIGFDAWVDDMEEQEQPTCNIDNQEDCENCGS